MATGASASPLVSVIVPAFQAAEYIEATLNAARAQTVEAIEIIVVDDGSTDATAAVAEGVAAADPRVRVLSQPNGGVAAARNAAIAAARSPIIAPLDADDLWKPEKLELQLAALAAAGSDCVLAYSWHVAVDESGAIVGPLDFRPRATGRDPAQFALQNLAGASSPLFRRAAVEKLGGYDATLRSRGGQGSEDWKLLAQLAAAGPVTLVPRFLMGYRRVQGSMSRDHKAALASHLVATADIRAAMPELPPPVLLWSELIHSTFMARTYWRERQRSTAARMVAWTAARALRNDPLFLTRKSLRTYLRMRIARSRSSAGNGAVGQTFLTADLSEFEDAEQSAFDVARDRFVAAVTG